MKKSIYRSIGCGHIELHRSTILNIDKILAKKLNVTWVPMQIPILLFIAKHESWILLIYQKYYNWMRRARQEYAKKNGEVKIGIYNKNLGGKKSINSHIQYCWR